MSQQTATAQNAIRYTVKMPYAKSWTDHVTEWIERRPGPSWAFYLGALLFLAIMNNVIFWIDGSQAVGSFEFTKTADAMFVVYFLAIYHYLSRVAGECFDVFQPVLKQSEADLQIVRYRLTTFPQWLGWLVLVGGTIVAVYDVVSHPTEFHIINARTLLPLIYQSAIFSVVLICFPVLFIQTIRQLLLVNVLHQQASEIDMFRLTPFHAFAVFTARAGIALVLFVAYNGLFAVFDPSAGAPLSAILSLSVLAICIFVIPLLGIQNRLQDEKAQLLDATHARIKTTMERVEREVDADSYEKIAGLKTAMAALIVKRDFVAAISTWPWDGSTFRSFASTLVLPLVLWLVTRLLERFV